MRGGGLARRGPTETPPPPLTPRPARRAHRAPPPLRAPAPPPPTARADHARETEAAAALHDLRHTIDVDEAIDEFAVTLLSAMVAAAAAFSFTRHFFVPSLARRSRSPLARGLQNSEVEAALASALGERLDAP